MYFNLSPHASMDTFSNLGLRHPLMIGNEFATPPLQVPEDEAQNDTTLDRNLLLDNDGLNG